MACVAEFARRLGRLGREQNAALDALGQFVPAVREAASRAMAAMKPELRRSHAQQREARRQSLGKQAEQGHAAKRSRGPGLGM